VADTISNPALTATTADLDLTEGDLCTMTLTSSNKDLTFTDLRVWLQTQPR
jgi:hypothetical protein